METSSSSSKGDWLTTGGPYAPTTSTIGLIEAPLDQVVEAYVAWGASLGRHLDVRDVPQGFGPALASLLPLAAAERRRHIFFATQSGWTAFFDNGSSGTDVFPVASYLARKINCRSCRAVVMPKCSWAHPASIFELFGPAGAPPLGYIRAVSSVFDGKKWMFSATGTPQPFEDLQAYQKRSIRERLTPTMVTDYLGALGANPFEVGFYKSATLIERRGSLNEGPLFSTFEAARLRFGLS